MEGIEYVVLGISGSHDVDGNMAALEFHIPFNRMDSQDESRCIDFGSGMPSKDKPFPQVAEAALNRP
jgi:DNA primase